MNIVLRRVLIECLPLVSGLSGGSVVATGYVALLGSDHYVGAFVVFSLWGAGLVVGGQALNLRQSKPLRLILRLGHPIWAYAFFTATVPVLVVFAAKRQLLEGLFYTGFGINMTYLGVKYRCDLIGCCWARRRTAFRLPLDQLHLGLQKFECLATVCILVFAFPLYCIGFRGASITTLYLGHAAVRLYGSYLKQPNMSRRAPPINCIGVALIGIAGVMVDRLIAR